MNNIEIVKKPYVYSGSFTNENGDTIEYYQLRTDVRVGDSVIHLSKPLKGLEKEYIRSLMAQDHLNNEISDYTENE